MVQNIPLKYGIIAGVGVIVYLLVFYFIDPKLMLHGAVMWSTLIIYLICMYRATILERERMETFSFRQAIRPSFTVYVLATLLYYTFYYLLFNVIDPGMAEIQRDLMIDQSTRLAESIGATDLEDQIQELTAEDMRVTLGNTILGVGWSLIGGFVLSLIFAGVLRRE